MKGYIFFFVAAAIALSSCSRNRAEELYDTAQLEELQNNKDHAKELYQEIVEKHPDSEYARTARDRLCEMEKKQ